MVMSQNDLNPKTHGIKCPHLILKQLTNVSTNHFILEQNQLDHQFKFAHIFMNSS
jgi:hypothetical protein